MGWESDGDNFCLNKPHAGGGERFWWCGTTRRLGGRRYHHGMEDLCTGLDATDARPSRCSFPEGRELSADTRDEVGKVVEAGTTAARWYGIQGTKGTNQGKSNQIK